jgi:DCN1-like protein 4/5
VSTSSATTAKSVSPVKSSSSVKTYPPPPSEPYTSQRSLALFKSYADSDNPDVIGPEGYEKLCNDASLPLEGALPLILAWQLGSKEMARITKEEWTSGTESLRSVVHLSQSIFFGKLRPRISSLSLLSVAVHDLDNYLMLEKAAPKKLAKKDPYDRTTFWSYCDNKKLAFQKFYTFCFVLAKPE